MELQQRGIFTFSVFSYDSETGILSRKGLPLHMTTQVRVILCAFLQSAGTIVTREQLRDLLWPDGEHLDYDHAINNIVQRLRELLGENRRTILYIETIPKLGYRFIAPVTFVPIQEQDQAQHIAVAELDPSSNARRPVDAAPSVTAAKSLFIKKLLRASAYLLAIVAIGAGSWYAIYWHTRQDNQILNIGIPPFEEVSTNAQPISESFRMDLINALSEMPALQIRAAHSLAMPLNDESSIRTVAQAQKLDLLLFGRMQQKGDYFTLQLELVRGSDAVHLGSFSYQGNISELETVREKIRTDIFNKLGLARRTKWKTQTAETNPTAYQAYLNARQDLMDSSDDSIREALIHYQQAIAADPNFAAAYAGQANALITLTEHESLPYEYGYRKAETSVRKALQLMPDNAEAHAFLGQIILQHDWNFPQAEREMRRAIELDPGRADYRIWLSVLLVDMKRFDESINQIEIAEASDPNWAEIYLTETFIYHFAGREKDAIRAQNKLMELAPTWPLAYTQRGWFNWDMKHYQDAISDWKHAALLENDTTRLQIENEGLKAFQHGGVKAYADVRLKYIHSGRPLNHALLDFVPAEWDCIAGNYDKAMTEVENMVKRHDPNAPYIATDRALWPLHSSPRFSVALAPLGLDPANLGEVNK